MKEKLLCDGCTSLNEVEIIDEYWETTEEEEFQTFECEKCKKTNSISFSRDITFNVCLKEDKE